MKTKSLLFILLAMLFVACGQTADGDQVSNPSPTYKVGSDVVYDQVDSSTSDDFVSQKVLAELGLSEEGAYTFDLQEASTVFKRLQALENSLRQSSVTSHKYEAALNRTTTEFPRYAFDDNFYSHTPDGAEYRMIAQMEGNPLRLYWANLSLILPEDTLVSQELSTYIYFDHNGKVVGGDVIVLSSDLSKAGVNKGDANLDFVVAMQRLSDEGKFYDTFIMMFEELALRVVAKTS